MQNVPGVTILKGPKDWQIFQRNPEGVADIFIEGTWLTDVSNFSIQVRVVNENSNMPVTSYLDWTDAEVNFENQQFTITLKAVPQGGLYRLETRLKPVSTADTRARRGDYVHHLGVGDIYVIAGQSNASGTGKGVATDGPLLGVHLFANDENWKLATHPLEDATNTLHPVTITGIFHGHSPWLAFGKTIYLKTGIPIGLIPTALGGSPISRWVKEAGAGMTGDLFDNMADMVQKGGGEIAGVLWYQGESDAALNKVGEYKDRFKSFVEATRDLAKNNKLPIFTAQLNSCSLELMSDAAWSGIREAQRLLSHKLARVYLIVTVDCPLSDEIHNRAGSNIWIGERFALSALENYYNEPVLSRFPEVSEIEFVKGNRQTLKLTFNFVAGDWSRGAANTDFSVQDEEGGLSVQKQEFGDNQTILLELNREATGKTTVHGLYGSHPVPTLFDDNGRCITPFSVSLD